MRPASLIAAACLALGPVAGTAASRASDVTNYQQSAQHDGQSAVPIAKHPRLRWRRRFRAAVSYPLVVGHRIFVTVGAVPVLHVDRARPSRPWPPASLVAIDARSGRTLWSRPIQGTESHIAYDSGRIVDVSFNTVAAYAPRTGRRLWSAFPHFSWGAPPVAGGGTAYFIADGDFPTEVFAVDVRTGRFRWIRNATDEVRVPLALTATAVIDSPGCLLSRADGSNVPPVLCVGGYGDTPVVAGNHLYLGSYPDPPRGRVMDLSSRMILRSLDWTQSAAVARGVAVAAADTQVRAFSDSTGAALWTFDSRLGFGQPPVIAGNVVYVLSFTRTLHALSLTTGHELWRKRISGPGTRHDYGSTWRGLAADDGLLVVPFEHTLSVYR